LAGGAAIRALEGVVHVLDLLARKFARQGRNSFAVPISAAWAAARPSVEACHAPNARQLRRATRDRPPVVGAAAESPIVWRSERRSVSLRREATRSHLHRPDPRARAEPTVRWRVS